MATSYYFFRCPKCKVAMKLKPSRMSYGKYICKACNSIVDAEKMFQRNDGKVFKV